MSIFGMALSESEQLQRAEERAAARLRMDERTFCTLYERTARPLWAYLHRMSGNPALADDILQEAYYRILVTKLPEVNQDYMKNYLFRIATNLLRDHWRKSKNSAGAIAYGRDAADPAGTPAEDRSDLARVFGELKPGERKMLWLAYVEGSTHREIAEIVGLKESSIRPLLFRARRRLASLLRAKGLVT
jgi:RNA polymerase sigma-70 factor, ECF subfamily